MKDAGESTWVNFKRTVCYNVAFRQLWPPLKAGKCIAQSELTEEPKYAAIGTSGAD